MNQNRFNEKASQWDEKPQRVELAHAVAQAIAREIPICNTMTALEFGCGTGLVSMELAASVDQIHAIDTSQGMLEMLNQKIQTQNVTNITTQWFDLTKESLDNSRFDLIFSSMVLHHIEDIDSLLIKLYSLLNAKGYLAIADLAKEDGQFHKEEEAVPHPGFDPDNLQLLLRKIGLINLKSAPVHTIVRPDRQDREKEYPVILTIGQKK
jgi:ubiquinone/menaquinone biosynthesis C-methylase UbiE